jgi:hypothetical protein
MIYINKIKKSSLFVFEMHFPHKEMYERMCDMHMAVKALVP